MVKMLTVVFPAVEFPIGLSTRTVRVPAVAVDRIDTFAVSVVPAPLAATLVTVIAASGVEAPRKRKSVAPVRFTPVIVMLKLLPRAALLGLIAVITGTFATLALEIIDPCAASLGTAP